MSASFGPPGVQASRAVN